MNMLKEARSLYDLGFAVHWIKPNSKAPVKSGWAGPKRDDWEVVKKDYREGYGLGVRLGQSSKVDGGYLANIDVDIKSAEPKHREEALSLLEQKFPGLLKVAPTVKTGYGLRLFVKTREPLQSGKLSASSDLTKAYMPDQPVSGQQLKALEEGLISKEELDKGYRVRAAWELEFMSAGKQVVLPPSIHPNTKKPYVWERPLNGHLPGIKAETLALGVAKGRKARKGLINFEPASIDLAGSKLPERTKAMIISGENVEDRSAALLTVSMVMVKYGFTSKEILTILTEPSYFLGEVAYEHAHTEDRQVAAQWVDNYTLQKAQTAVSAAKTFADEVGVTPLLDDDAALEQAKELLPPAVKKNWRARLDTTEKGATKPTLKNVVLILENAVAPSVFRRNLFALRDFYGVATPWGGEVGASLTDDDGAKIKLWLGNKFKIEPSKDTIYDAMTVISTRNGFHPVQDELNALPDWDGVNRIDGWLKSYFSAKGPDDYLAQVFRKWLVASVTRTYEPGAKFDWMILLEGDQGTGKSSFGSILFGDDYFTDWLPPLADKDAALGLQGIRCVEFGELDQLRRNEIETIKAFVTRRIDKVRPPYGKRWLESKRQCVFFGTTNRDEYLKDDTGNRRFNPIMVGKLNFGALERDRDQLWAEALFIYQNALEPTLYLEGEAENYSKLIQGEKIVSDETTFMVESLKKFLASDFNLSDFSPDKFKITALFGGIGGIGPFARWAENARNLQFASRALKMVGAKKRKIKGESYWGIATH